MTYLHTFTELELHLITFNFFFVCVITFNFFFVCVSYRAVIAVRKHRQPITAWASLQSPHCFSGGAVALTFSYILHWLSVRFGPGCVAAVTQNINRSYLNTTCIQPRTYLNTYTEVWTHMHRHTHTHTHTDAGRLRNSRPLALLPYILFAALSIFLSNLWKSDVLFVLRCDPWAPNVLRHLLGVSSRGLGCDGVGNTGQTESRTASDSPGFTNANAET